MTQEQKDAFFANEIKQLHQQNRKVMLSLGGADAHIVLTKKQEDAFVAEILRLVKKFGFDGVDIDLEQQALTIGMNILCIIIKLLSDITNPATLPKFNKVIIILLLI